MTCTCLVCGGPFEAKPVKVRAGTAKYCSNPCRYAALRVPLAERFREMVNQGAPNECWLWIGNRPDGRYGMIKVNGRNVHAHRVAWMLANGPIPDAQFVLHRCDNPPCVNPAHLFLGTPRSNVQDAISKGRFGKNRAVLSEENVHHIRSLMSNGRLPRGTGRGLARSLGVCEHTISRVVRGHHWG